MSTGIQVGTTKEGVVAMKNAIIEILKVPRGDEVVKAALTVLAEGVKVEGTVVSGCTVSMNEKK